MPNPAPTPAPPAPIVVQAVPASTVALPPCPCHRIDLGEANEPIEVEPTPAIKATCR